MLKIHIFDEKSNFYKKKTLFHIENANFNHCHFSTLLFIPAHRLDHMMTAVDNQVQRVRQMGNVPFMEANQAPPHPNPPRLQHATQLERVNSLLANVRSLVDTNIRFLRSDVPRAGETSTRDSNYFRNFYESWPMILQQLIVVMHEMSNWDVDLARGNRIMRYTSNARRPGMPPVGSGSSLNRTGATDGSASGETATPVTGSLFI